MIFPIVAKVVASPPGFYLQEDPSSDWASLSRTHPGSEPPWTPSLVPPAGERESDEFGHHHYHHNWSSPSSSSSSSPDRRWRWFGASASSSSSCFLGVLYQHEILKRLPPISLRVQWISSRWWTKYYVKHPSSILVKIQEMISVKTFYLPQLRRKETSPHLAPPPKQIRDGPRGTWKWWNQQISSSRWETNTLLLVYMV